MAIEGRMSDWDWASLGCLKIMFVLQAVVCTALAIQLLLENNALGLWLLMWALASLFINVVMWKVQSTRRDQFVVFGSDDSEATSIAQREKKATLSTSAEACAGVTSPKVPSSNLSGLSMR
jgi:hypothetical protein